MAAHAQRRGAPVLWFALALTAVYTFSVLVTLQPAFAAPGAGPLALGVTLDLTLGVPALYWFLVVRRTSVPAITVVPVWLLSLAGAAIVLPEAREEYLRAVRALIVPVELLVVSYAAVKITREVRRYRAQAPRELEGDFLDRVRARLRFSIPGHTLPEALALEIALMYYAFFSWRERPRAASGETAYSYHREGGVAGLYAALIMVMVVETVAVHLLVHPWRPAVAWTLTAVSVYGLVWMLGFVQSVRLRPVRLSRDCLHVRMGLMWSADVPVHAIHALTESPTAVPDRKDPEYLHAALVARPTLVVELAEPVRAEGPYGIRKDGVRRIGLAVDRRDHLVAELSRRIGAVREGAAT